MSSFFLRLCALLIAGLHAGPCILPPAWTVPGLRSLKIPQDDLLAKHRELVSAAKQGPTAVGRSLHSRLRSAAVHFSPVMSFYSTACAGSSLRACSRSCGRPSSRRRGRRSPQAHAPTSLSPQVATHSCTLRTHHEGLQTEPYRI